MKRRSRREAACWVALLSSRVGPRGLARLISFRPDPAEALDAPEEFLREQCGFTVEEALRLRRPPDPDRLRQALQAWETTGMKLVAFGDSDYPATLAASPAPPPALFVLGDLDPADRLAVAIVGSRQATGGGLEMAARLARELAPMFTIVSGLALGVDSAAHAGALESGGRTIGVAACGLDIDYPVGNRDLRQLLASGGRGAVISPFLPGTPALPALFPQRNQVLAALSLATVVVEARARSGALSTARAAADFGRPVFAVPGDPTRQTSEGTNELIRDGATLCTRAADIIADLEGALRGELEHLRRRRLMPPVPVPEVAPGRERTTRLPRVATAPSAAELPAAPRSPSSPPGDPAQAAIHELLVRHGATHQDALIAELVPARMALGKFSEAMLMLELSGHIRREPGGEWSAS